jgi:predicted nucleic acid-binding protein
MQYLLDTVAVIRHFTGSGKIGSKASLVFNNLENKENCFVISVISLMEVMYLAEKHRIDINLTETLKTIESSSKYIIADLTPDILKVAETVEFYGLHDRLILATAKWLGIQIISSDSKLDEVDGIKVLWD